MRLLICAGGTGGGVYPALAVHGALTSKVTDVDTLWVGGEGGMEASLVKRQSIPFRSIPAAGVHGIGLLRLPRNLAQLGRGVLAARKILKDFQPDVLFFTGGYVAVPMALAGRSIPCVLYVPDIEPGMALKSLARFADVIAVTTEESQKFFNKPVYETGYPLRSDLALWDRQMAQQHLNISAKLPVLLVFGGSKGAHSINLAVLNHLQAMLTKFELIHLSGEADWQMVSEMRAQLPQELIARYHAMPYLHEMGAALAAADLVISRAGASTLGEYPQFALPAILVPYPYAWRYQKVNADYLSSQGAAITVEDGDLAEKLLPTVKEILQTPERLESMRTAMRSLAHPGAAEEIGQELLTLAEKRS